MGHGDRRSLFVTWLVSYLSILLIPLSISGVVHVYSSRAIAEEIDRANLVLIDQIRQEVDSQLREIARLGSQIGLNARLQSLLNASSPITPQQRISMMDLIRDFGVLGAVSGYVEDFYVYLPAIGGGIGSTSNYAEQYLFEHFHGGSDFSREDWLTALGAIRTPTFTTIPRSRGDGATRTVAYVAPLPIGAEGERRGSLVILVDEAGLAATIGSFRYAADSTVVLMDQKSVLLSSGTGDYRPLLESARSVETGRETVMLDGEAHVVNHLTSTLTGWRYAVLTPQRVYAARALFTRRLILWSVILCVSFGGLAAWFFTRRTYARVRDLTEVVRSSLGITHTRELLNEYAFIREAVRTAAAERREIEDRFRQQEADIEALLLMRILKGRIHSMDELYDVLHGRGLGGPVWAVLFFLPDEMQTDEGAMGGPRERRPAADVLGYVMRNALQETLGRALTVLSVEIDNGTAVIASGSEERLSREALLGQAASARDTLARDFRIHATVAASGLHDSPAGLPEAYVEARYALEYRLLWGVGTVIPFEGFRDTPSVYWYPLECEIKLINAVKAGNVEDSLRILEEVFRRNLGHGMPSIAMARCLFFDLASTTIKITNELGGVLGGEDPNDAVPADRILRCKSAEEMKTVMADLIRRLAGRIGSSRSSQGREVVEKVKRYIETKYEDVNLNVAAVAAAVNLTPNYLSHLFREQTGVLLHEYATRFRVERAKVLLAKREMSIKEIAHATGFANSNSFIRAFKRCEGVTPGHLVAPDAVSESAV